MIELSVIELSRLQFAVTAMFHFIFVPLTLGLSLLLGIMETVYVLTGKKIWRDMTKFWGLLFGINFAIGVSTGITMEFQFGTNWAYYSHYVGDIFGVPLAIEGMMAFFLEGTFVGLFFFGWNKLSKGAHLTVTWLLALATNLSALWILIANAWMQHPVGAKFNFETMRMEVSSFAEVLFNPVAQAKFVHTVSAGYVTGAMFVLSISAYYLLRNRNIDIAKRSITIASAFGLAGALCVAVLGDESGYIATENQKMKVAAMESMWETEPAPASLTLIGLPDQATRTTRYAVKVPYLLGLIATRSTNTPVLGINDLVKQAESRIYTGIKAYSALELLKRDPTDLEAKKQLDKYVDDLGYALLLKTHTNNVVDATPEQIHEAALSTIPNVAALFWSFRGMVACGFLFIAVFLTAFLFSLSRKIETKRWFLKIAMLSLPLPIIAAELGWFVAENGRQPWVIDGILPTSLGASSLSSTDLWISLSGFVLLYGSLMVIEFFLMIKYIRLGPEYQLNKSMEKKS